MREIFIVYRIWIMLTLAIGLIFIIYCAVEIRKDTIDRRLKSRFWNINELDRDKYPEFDYFLSYDKISFRENYTGMINTNQFNWEVIDEQDKKLQLTNFKRGDKFNGIYDVKLVSLKGCVSGIILKKDTILFQLCEKNISPPEWPSNRLIF